MNRRGFTLTECAAVLVLLVVVAALGQPKGLAPDPKEQTTCASNLRQLGIASMNYAVDFRDSLPTFTWRAGNTQSEDPSLRNAADDVQATADQALNMLRRNAGRRDIGRINGWLPHVNANPIVLVDYLQQKLPDPVLVCPSDAPRMSFLKLRGPDGLVPAAAVPAADNAAKRWGYTSSYQLTASAFSPGTAGDGIGALIAQGATDDEYLIPKDKPLGKRAARLTDIAFPSAKALYFEGFDRHSEKRGHHFGLLDNPAPMINLLTADGAVGQKSTKYANGGWRANDPRNAEPSVFAYRPAGEALKWNPAPTKPDGDANLHGYYRWTRSGLRGVDFDAAEIPAEKGATQPADAFVKSAP